jgi:predicted nucleic acid-binding protein
MLKVDDEIFKGAWQQFRTQKKPKFSFTDATTAELMRRYDIGSIATFDGVFQEETGYVAIGH